MALLTREQLTAFHKDIYLPLRHFIRNSVHDFEDFKEYVYKKYERRIPSNLAIRGYLVEEYARYFFDRFAGYTSYFVHRSFGDWIDVNGNYYSITDQGNLDIHNESYNKNGDFCKGDSMFESDGLYEYYYKSSVIPVLLEVSMNTNVGGNNKRRDALAKQLENIYEYRPVLIRVRVGDYKHNKKLRNIIVTKRRKELDLFAIELSEFIVPINT